MRLIKSIFLFICLSSTYMILFYPLKLLRKQMWMRSQCVCLEWNITRDAGESGRIISNESPFRLKTVDSGENSRVLIWVLTGPSRHMVHALHVKRTWGVHFDKLLLMSSEEDERLGTIALENVTEGHDKVWPKTQKAFKYVWEHHKEDADWFMKADDDTFVVSHNLQDFLKDLDPNEPHYIGCNLEWDDVPVPVNYGGTGYILSKEALRLFIEALGRGGDCHTEIRRKYKGDEDTELGICMASINVPAEEAVDSDGREQMIMVGSADDFDNALANFNGNWPLNYSEWSPRAISFHSISPSQMYVLEHLAHTMRMF